MKNDVWLKERQVAEILCVSTATLRMWRKKGLGPMCRKVVGRYKYSEKELEEWIGMCGVRGGGVVVAE